jgi:Cep192 domain 4
VRRGVLKWTWLLDRVEVTGFVREHPEHPALEDGTFDRDDFDVVLDPIHAHMVATSPGSRGAVHCETYVEGFEDRSMINRTAPWWLSATKGEGVVFMVRHPATNASRALRVGDHVRLVGRWIIENGHPWGGGGFLVYHGFVFMEFHPVDWTRIELVVPPRASAATVEQIALAAPIYEEVFPNDWWWNRVNWIGNTIYFNENADNFHATMTADSKIKAPGLPAASSPISSLVAYDETVLALGTGLVLDDVRTVFVEKDGIRVLASVTAPPDMSAPTGENNAFFLANQSDPAFGRSIFQARYAVWWKPRLVPQSPEIVATGSLGQTVGFSIHLDNVGPDPLTIAGVDIYDLSPPGQPAFEVDLPTNPSIAPYGSIELTARFKPQSAYHKATLIVRSDDPSERHPAIALRGGLPLGTFSLDSLLGEHTLRATAYRLAATPNPLPFPETAVGGQSTRNLSVVNSFPTPVAVQLAIAQPSVFHLLGPAGLQLAAQATATLPLNFEPTSSGSFTGALTITEVGNPQNQRLVQLQGTATGET